MCKVENINNSLKTFVDAIIEKLNDGIFTNIDLEKEAKAKEQYPVYLTANLAILVEAIEPLNLADQTFENILKEIDGDLKKLLKSKGPDEFFSNIKKLFDVKASEQLPDVFKSLLETNTDLALSFGISWKHFPNLNAKYYGNAILGYFFNEKGYTTVSGKSIQPPQLASASEDEEGNDIPAIKKMIKDLKQQIQKAGEQATAEQYIRDMTRISVEVTWDQIYGLEKRYKELKEKYGKDDKKKKLVAWFDSFGELAAASVLPVVETVLSGIGDVELNPKIVTGIGTFCSTTARKAIEHAYLQAIGIKQP